MIGKARDMQRYMTAVRSLLWDGPVKMCDYKGRMLCVRMMWCCAEPAPIRRNII